MGVGVVGDVSWQLGRICGHTALRKGEGEVWGGGTLGESALGGEKEGVEVEVVMEISSCWGLHSRCSLAIEKLSLRE